MRNILNKAFFSSGVLSCGSILEISQALDELIVQYQKMINE